jgi:hypothetical protein
MTMNTVGKKTMHSVVPTYENLLEKEGFWGRFCVPKNSTRNCVGMPGYTFRSTTVSSG